MRILHSVKDGELKCETKEIILVDQKFTVYQGYVTFDAGEGTVSPETVEIVSKRKAASLPVPVWEGHNFEYWALSDGTQVTTGTQFSGNTTVYAKWEGEELVIPTPTPTPTPTPNPTPTPVPSYEPEPAPQTPLVTEAPAAPLLSPQTGDNATLIFWVVMIVLSLAVILVIGKAKKK